MRLLPLPVATAGALLALTGTASAAYGPQLQIKLDPATAATPPAMTSIVTHTPGETPPKTARGSFPVGFAPQLGAKVATCQPAGEANQAWPAVAQLGVV